MFMSVNELCHISVRLRSGTSLGFLKRTKNQNERQETINYEGLHNETTNAIGAMKKFTSRPLLLDYIKAMESLEDECSD